MRLIADVQIPMWQWILGVIVFTNASVVLFLAVANAVPLVRAWVFETFAKGE